MIHKLLRVHNGTLWKTDWLLGSFCFQPLDYIKRELEIHQLDYIFKYYFPSTQCLTLSK